MTVPLDSERQASELPEVRAVYEAFDQAPRVGAMTEANHRMLCEAVTAASLELGAYDHRILLSLAGFDPMTCAVVATLITRAAARPGLTAGQLEVIGRALSDAIAYRVPDGFCMDCARDAAGECSCCLADNTLAAAYQTLGHELGISPEARARREEER
jgi:hypothetical protein